MKTTIHLVQASDIVGTNVMLPLSVGILWQYAIQDLNIRKSWELGKVVYKREDLDLLAEKLATGDLVCFSNYIWNADYHFALATKIKKINPEVCIVFGGPDITPDKKLFWLEKQSVVDLAIVGEGEDSFKKILETFPKFDLDSIPGAWTQSYFKEVAPRVTHYPYEASPYLNGFFDHIVSQEIELGNTVQATIQTNRGCPYRCTFCEEGKEYKSKLFFYDQDRIKDEFIWCAKNKIEFISIADDNFGLAERDIEFFKLARDLHLEHGYPKVIDATFAKNAVTNLLRLADIDQEYNTNLIRGFTVALQSVNTPTLKSIKRFNLIPHKQIELIQGLRERNKPTYTEVIWPLPYETLETFKQGIDDIIKIGLDNWLGVYPLALIEGTDLYQDHVQDFLFIKQQSHNFNKKDDSHTVKCNTVISSTWATKEDIIKGQIFYTWLASLFFFGFARLVFQEIAKKQNISISQVLDKFILFAENNKELAINGYNQRIRHWWDTWYNGDIVPDISLFPNQDTSGWSPYAHLSSYIQSDFNNFQQELALFVEHEHVDIETDILDQTSHSVILYNRDYPYTTSTLSVSSVDSIPKFKSLFEFCRYFYWWRRKSGWHRTKVRSILAQETE